MESEDDIHHGDSGHLLQSGLRGLSEEEKSTVKNRLRLRLGILSPKMLVSGKTPLDAVSALGLTRFTEEDMNDFVNMLSDFIGLQFQSIPHRRPSQNSMNAMFGFADSELGDPFFLTPCIFFPTPWLPPRPLRPLHGPGGPLSCF